MSMARGVFYFDVVSPFAYLCFARLKRLNLPIALEYRPVLFAALLNHFGQLGPAEVPGKRIFTYEHCTWLAEQDGIAFLMPTAHPFNPLRYLRLIIALGATQAVIEQVFETLFTTGLDPEAPRTFEQLMAALKVRDAHSMIDAADVKAQLRANTDEAIDAGVFGVPSITVDGRLFWGADALMMLKSYLADDGSLDSAAMRAARQVRVGATRV